MKDGASEIVEVKGLWVHLWLHGETNPTAELWEGGLEHARRVMLARHAILRNYRGLVFSDGGAPNAKQREQLARGLLGGVPVRSSVVTNVLDNPVKRGVATALQWLNPLIRFYTSADVVQALAHIGLEDAWHDLLSHLHALQVGVVPVRALRDAEQVMRRGSRSVR